MEEVVCIMGGVEEMEVSLPFIFTMEGGMPEIVCIEEVNNHYDD